MIHFITTPFSVGDSEADWLLRSRDPNSGPWVESLTRARAAASKIVHIMNRGVQFLRDNNKLDENRYSRQTLIIVALETTEFSVLRVKHIQEVFLCGFRFFGYFNGCAATIGTDNADWIDLGRQFLNAAREAQELHQTLEVRLIIKAFRCLGKNGSTTANDILMLFSILSKIERPKSSPRRLDEELSFENRSVKSLRDHLGLSSCPFLGTIYQVYIHAFCLLS